jgi:hypothetical protein
VGGVSQYAERAIFDRRFAELMKRHGEAAQRLHVSTAALIQAKWTRRSRGGVGFGGPAMSALEGEADIPDPRSSVRY